MIYKDISLIFFLSKYSINNLCFAVQNGGCSLETSSLRHIMTLMQKVNIVIEGKLKILKETRNMEKFCTFILCPANPLLFLWK